MVAYVWLTLAHSGVASLVVGSVATGISWRLVLTGIYSVVRRRVTPDRSGVAAGVVVTMRITGTVVGVQAAFAAISAAGIAGASPAEAGFTRAFAIGALGAAATLAAAASLPGRLRGL